MRKRMLSALITISVIAGLIMSPLRESPQAARVLGQTAVPACDVAEATASPTISATPGMHVTTPVPAGSARLQHLADIPLPGDTSRFDYQSFVPVTGQLYISHMDAGQLVVFDTKSQQVIGTVDDLPTVTGVLVVPEVHRIFAAVAGDHQVAVIDTRDLRVVARVGKIDFPDGLAYAPQTKQVFVSDESGGGELVIDAVTNQIVTTIDIGGEAGNTHYDAGSGCIVVAVQTQNQLVVVDPTTDQVVGNTEVKNGCQSPHGFLIDAPHRLAFVTCEDDATLLVVDLTTMQVNMTFGTGEGPDVLALDPGWGQLYVASEAGTVSIFDERGDTLHAVGDYRAPHAHSVAVDPVTHLVYLPLEDIDGRPVLRIMAPCNLATDVRQEPGRRATYEVKLATIMGEIE